MVSRCQEHLGKIRRIDKALSDKDKIRGGSCGKQLNERHERGQGCRNSNRAMGGVEKLRAMKTCKKNFTNYACFYVATMLTSKTLAAEIINNHYELSWCANICNKICFKSI